MPERSCHWGPDKLAGQGQPVRQETRDEREEIVAKVGGNRKPTTRPSEWSQDADGQRDGEI